MMMESERLKNIQANILGYHYKEHVKCIFIRFTEKGEPIFRWINKLSDQLTTAEMERRAYFEFKDKGTNPIKESLNFYLSSRGLQFIGCKKKEERNPADAAFWEGMAQRAIILDDPLAMDLEKEWAHHFFHAMIMIASDDDKALNSIQNEIEDELENEKLGKVIHVETGKALFQPSTKKRIEHFGFRDGLSKLNFYKNNGDKKVYPPEIVLDEQDGSYLVFRKLKQDVKKFEDRIRNLCFKLKIPEEYANARIVGRFKNGESLSGLNKPSEKNSDPYRVDFSLDEEGMKCPYHAHIRKSNPRSLDEKLIHRIGIPYGERGGSNVGLLFMCMQKDIKNQFEHIQVKWMNNENFPEPGSGIDPIAGQKVSLHRCHAPRRVRDLGPSYVRKEANELNGTVALMGGEYFYAASISWLRELKPFEEGVIEQKVAFSDSYDFEGSYSMINNQIY